MAYGIVHLDTPVTVTVSAYDSWQTYDLDDYVAGLGADVTGVIVRATPNNYENFQLRPVGSSWSDADNIHHNWYVTKMCGVNSSHQFQMYVKSGMAEVVIEGYTLDGWVWFTDPVNVTPSSSGVWTETDLSVSCPNAIGAYFEAWQYGGDGTTAIGFRKKGSADARIDAFYDPFNESTIASMVGLDASQKCDVYRGGWCYVYLWGYCTQVSGNVFNTNATNVSLSSTGSWQDLAALPSGASGAIIEVVGGYDKTYGLRKKGSGVDWKKSIEHIHCWHFIPCDSGGVVQGYISDASVDFFVVGYFTGRIAPSSGGAQIIGLGL